MTAKRGMKLSDAERAARAARVAHARRSNLPWLTEQVATRDRTTGCWIWPFGKDSKGYGRCNAFGCVLVPQIALILDGQPRPDPPGDCALHSCDTPSCFNPTCLRWGTKRDNRNDAEMRGRARHPRGQAHGRAKVNAEQVAQIRRSSAPLRELVAEFGISRSQVQRIRRGESWIPTPEGDK